MVIIDVATGRERHRSRYQDGVHNCLEAKEELVVQPDTSPQLSITYQCLFKYYDLLAGMTVGGCTGSGRRVSASGSVCCVAAARKLCSSGA